MNRVRVNQYHFGQFREEDHPRDDDGKWTDKGGGGKARRPKPSPRTNEQTGHVEIEHGEYPEYLKDLSDDELRYTIKDAQEAMDAFPNNPKAGYYADEVNYAAMEIARRKAEAQKGGETTAEGSPQEEQGPEAQVISQIEAFVEKYGEGPQRLHAKPDDPGEFARALELARAENPDWWAVHHALWTGDMNSEYSSGGRYRNVDGRKDAKRLMAVVKKLDKASKAKPKAKKRDEPELTFCNDGKDKPKWRPAIP